ncbi:MAG TPA: DUF6732 family protein [Thermohalobaculum sp.]|nr:DUF6732 family protein [Thermohalobaculum sp.]
MKTALATLTALIASPALADPGHFAESHGHSHWLAAAALALAAVIGAVALWRSRSSRPAAKAERRA